MLSVRTPLLLGLCMFLAPFVSGCSQSRYATDYDDERYDRYERRNTGRASSDERRQWRSPRNAYSEAASPTAEPSTKRSSQTAIARSERAPASSTKTKTAETTAAPAATETAKAAQPAIEQPAKPASPPVAAANPQPAAASSGAAAKPADEASQKTAKKQIEDGYRLLRAGFVKKARERFDLAMNSYAAEASLAQGRSMDPSYLKSVAFPDVKPEAEEARRLYRRAIMLGNNEAKGDLDRLEKALAAAEPAPAPAAANTEPQAPADQPKSQ